MWYFDKVLRYYCRLSNKLVRLLINFTSLSLQFMLDLADLMFSATSYLKPVIYRHALMMIVSSPYSVVYGSCLSITLSPGCVSTLMLKLEVIRIRVSQDRSFIVSFFILFYFLQ